MNRLLLIWVLLLGLISSLDSQVPEGDHHWRLVFEEQFDSIDPSVWKVANNFDHYGEPQVYTSRDENVYAADGELVIRVKREQYRCRERYGWACNRAWYEYTSGMIETRKEHYFHYGYLESRIKVPHGYGFWPAFWTFVGDDIPEKHNAAEIDIFEMVGTEPSTLMGTNMHMAYCNCNENECDCDYLNDFQCPEVDSGILCHGLDVDIPDYAESYQTYGLEWNPSKIIWYVNGNVVRTSANPGIIDPARIIFNVAITPWNLPDETTRFPATMHIDYMKVYQLKKSEEVIDSCSIGFLDLGTLVRKEISIGGEGCSNSIPVNENITLRATEGIEIRGDFSVPLGAQLYLDVNELQ